MCSPGAGTTSRSLGTKADAASHFKSFGVINGDLSGPAPQQPVSWQQLCLAPWYHTHPLQKNGVHGFFQHFTGKTPIPIGGTNVDHSTRCSEKCLLVEVSTLCLPHGGLQRVNGGIFVLLGVGNTVSCILSCLRFYDGLETPGDRDQTLGVLNNVLQTFVMTWQKGHEIQNSEKRALGQAPKPSKLNFPPSKQGGGRPYPVTPQTPPSGPLADGFGGFRPLRKITHVSAHSGRCGLCAWDGKRQGQGQGQDQE